MRTRGVQKRAPALRQEPDGGWMRGLCVPFKCLDGATAPEKFGEFSRRQLRRDELVHRLAVDAPWPASLAITAFMTRPMSFGGRRAGLGDRLVDGRLDRRRHRSAAAGTPRASRSRPLPCRARSSRPPLRNCSIESRRCLMSDAITCCDSASSRARPFSTSRFIERGLHHPQRRQPRLVPGAHRGRHVGADVDPINAHGQLRLFNESARH